jgi:hypothetical protein
MATLQALLDGLGRDFGPINPEAKDERQIAARFEFEGRTWTVDSDTRIERLHDLARAMAAGRARVRPTRTGARQALTDRPDEKADGLYVYST